MIWYQDSSLPVIKHRCVYWLQKYNAATAANIAGGGALAVSPALRQKLLRFLKWSERSSKCNASSMSLRALFYLRLSPNISSSRYLHLSGSIAYIVFFLLAGKASFLWLLPFHSFWATESNAHKKINRAHFLPERLHYLQYAGWKIFILA